MTSETIKVKIIALDPKDAYYDNREIFIGRIMYYKNHEFTFAGRNDKAKATYATFKHYFLFTDGAKFKCQKLKMSKNQSRTKSTK